MPDSPQETPSTEQPDEQSSPERIGMRVTSDPDETTVEEPETSDARERLQFPLRLVLAGDLLPQAADDEDAPARLVRVDKHDFAELMRQFHPRLALEVPNTLAEGGQELDVELAFPSLDAFGPEGIARQVPATRRLLTLRTLVRRARDGEIDREAFRAEIEDAGIDEREVIGLYRALDESEAEASPGGSSGASEKDQSLNQILDMVDGGEPASAPSEDASTQDAPDADSDADPMEALMQAVSGEKEDGATADTAVADRLLRDLDARLSAQVGAILNEPSVRRLEAAWRGLKFLVDRLDFRSGIELEVLPVARDTLNEALYHQVLMPEHEGETGKSPLGAIVLDFSFGSGLHDFDQLRDLAEIGASLQVPLIGSAAASFFGLERAGGLAKLPPLRQHLDGPEYIEWNKLRDHEAARFLSLALPPFLLRAPRGADRSNGAAFSFEHDDGGLWGAAALAVAAALADSFAQTGWPTHLEAHALENLPLLAGPVAKMPLGALLSQRRLKELTDAGFTVLSGQPNKDVARVAGVSTIARPEAQEGAEAQAEARAHVSLPCQLFVARMAAALLRLQNEVPTTDGEDLQAVQDEVENRLSTFLGVEKAQSEGAQVLSIEHVEEASTPERQLLAVRLHPPEAALQRDVSLVMGMQVAVTGRD